MPLLPMEARRPGFNPVRVCTPPSKAIGHQVGWRSRCIIGQLNLDIATVSLLLLGAEPLDKQV